MKLRVSCLTLIATVAVWLPARAADAPIDFLSEETNLYFSYNKTKDTPAFEDHPIYKALATPALKKAFAPLLSQMAEGEEQAAKIWKEETGLTLEEAKKVMSGDIAVGMQLPITRMFEEIGKGGGASESPFTFIDIVGAAHFNGDEALAEKVAGAYLRMFKEGNARAIEKNPGTPKFSEFEASTENFEGVKLHLLKPKAGEKSLLVDPGWAFVDKMVVFASSAKALRNAVELGKKGGATLAKAPRFAPLAERAKSSNFLYYLDVKSTVGELVKQLKAKFADGAEVGGVDPVAITAALGVEKFDSAYLAGDFKDGSINADFGVTYHDKPGIMSLIAMDGPGKVPDFLPANATTGAYGTLHLDRVMTAIENLVKEGFPPAAAAIDTQLGEIKQKTGVDLKKDLLGNLGPDIWSVAGEFALPGKLSKPDASPLDVPTQPQVIGLRVKDKKAFQLALSSLINWAAPDQALFEEREYRGNTIRTVKGAPVPIGYVLTDDWFIFNMGPETLLEDVLGRLKNPGENHLFGQAKIQESLRSFPAGEDSTSYVDFGGLVQMIATLFRNLPDVDALKPIVDFKAIPENLNLNLIILSRTYIDDNSYRVHARLMEKSK